MGVIYCAEDVRLWWPVALEVPPLRPAPPGCVSRETARVLRRDMLPPVSKFRKRAFGALPCPPAAVT